MPADLFGGFSAKLVAHWRARAMTSHPSDFTENKPPVRLTLVAALAWCRTSEITDALVDLLIGLVSKINTRAERKVEKAMYAEAKTVHGKTAKLFSIAEAALRKPDDTVRKVVYPAVGGGTLRALVAEAKADQKAYRARVRTVLTSSYSSYYRRMLPKLLAAIEFKCNNTAYRPVMDALDLLARYAEVPNKVKQYDAAGKVPIKGVVPRRCSGTPISVMPPPTRSSAHGAAEWPSGARGADLPQIRTVSDTPAAAAGVSAERRMAGAAPACAHWHLIDRNLWMEGQECRRGPRLVSALP